MVLIIIAKFLILSFLLNTVLATNSLENWKRIKNVEEYLTEKNVKAVINGIGELSNIEFDTFVQDYFKSADELDKIHLAMVAAKNAKHYKVSGVENVEKKLPILDGLFKNGIKILLYTAELCANLETSFVEPELTKAKQICSKNGEKITQGIFLQFNLHFEKNKPVKKLPTRKMVAVATNRVAVENGSTGGKRIKILMQKNEANQLLKGMGGVGMRKSVDETADMLEGKYAQIGGAKKQHGGKLAKIDE